jgi:hypothetical protein
LLPSVCIPSRFNGPLDSGNGGYCAGVLAGSLDGPADVSLRHLVPLDMVRDGNGSARMLDGETLIAEAREAAEFEGGLIARR